MAQISDLAKSKGFVITSTATLTLVTGFVVGYKYARHILDQQYSKQLELELEKTREKYAREFKVDEFETPEKAVEALIPEEAVEALRVYTGGVPVKDQPRTKVAYHEMAAPAKVELERVNVFKKIELFEEEVVEEEVRDRTEEAPYIISAEEYFQNEEDFDQRTLTYYEGDMVLCDEEDKIINDIDVLVGDNNIPRFGHRSGEAHLLYVRNHSIEMEFEIHRSTGKYSVEVAGLDDDSP